MEVDGLGARCALPSCNTLDYLPFRCPDCTLSFCDTHASATSHNCRATTTRPDVPQCPLCKAPVPVPPTSTPDHAISRHIDLGCPKRARSNPACALPSCTTRDHAATRCPSCGRTFCLAHRLEADHSCAPRSAPRPNVGPFGNRVRPPRASAAASPRRGKGGAESPSKRGKAAAARAGASRRLDFSNASSAPIGDRKVDVEDRVTVAVFFPAGSKVAARYMYFSGRQSAGRIIDGLCKEVPGLPAPADGGRYCLYAVKRGGGGVNLLPHITPLKDLPADVLQSGDMLVLEQGESGLDPAWTAALHKLSSGSRLPSARRSFKSGKLDKCSVA